MEEDRVFGKELDRITCVEYVLLIHKNNFRPLGFLASKILLRGVFWGLQRTSLRHLEFFHRFRVVVGVVLGIDDEDRRNGPTFDAFHFIILDRKTHRFR
jgi:hypothetical protein